MRKILLLGASGSIGQSTINCVKRYPGDFELVGISFNNNTDKGKSILSQFDTIKYCAIANINTEIKFNGSFSAVEFYFGHDKLVEMVKNCEYDVLVNAIVGSAGFAPTAAALKRGKKVALANKESLVVGGEIIDGLLAEFGGSIVPIDSEHSAILQCIHGENRKELESITVTASGGPFRELQKEKFSEITPEKALKHPTWAMGAKITIDSATLMNKGFEVIEAYHLYKVNYDKINVVVHPQSIIHSMVTFIDGAVLAQCGYPDMELPIQYALTYPDRKYMMPTPRLDLAKIGQLTFFEPDLDKFPCLRLCIQAGKAGGTLPCVLNAANEVAVAKFIGKEIKFTQIAEIVETALNKHNRQTAESVEQILEIDREVRQNCL
ncbi:MAG: 1-deoxy-D-xylulose-5-phosphate reductoisomerase [Chitinispirillales bacterium]|jgi:1-deoxy-D-xylulose-5-phosphate reductoisomerase|nr:1-deoxy-D-xylulose-5-phosphate reductoisomerase [Chitinispirillales bacterium]